MQKIKISAVSYYNTFPFVFGIEKHNTLLKQIELSLDIPAVCAQKLTTQEADLGLIPVAAMENVPNAEIVSDFCIGADGKVETVLLLSDVPFSEVETIYLDYQSRTSVQLVQVLAREFWKISPEWQQTEQGYENGVGARNGAVIIGDRVFRLQHQYKYRYDLAEEWKRFTGLPFVFAAWVANRKLSEAFVSDFNAALQYGLENIDASIAHFQKEIPAGIDIEKYLKQDISYPLGEDKKKAMRLFLELAQANEVKR